MSVNSTWSALVSWHNKLAFEKCLIAFERLSESKLLVFCLHVYICMFQQGSISMLLQYVDFYRVYFSFKLKKKNICNCRTTSAGKTGHFCRKISYTDHKKSSSENFQYPYSL